MLAYLVLGLASPILCPLARARMPLSFLKTDARKLPARANPESDFFAHEPYLNYGDIPTAGRSRYLLSEICFLCLKASNANSHLEIVFTPEFFGILLELTRRSGLF